MERLARQTAAEKAAAQKAIDDAEKARQKQINAMRFGSTFGQLQGGNQ